MQTIVTLRYLYIYINCHGTTFNSLGIHFSHNKLDNDIYTLYRRSDFDCVVKRLRMALYKPDCDFNDCELPSGQYIIN